MMIDVNGSLSLTTDGDGDGRRIPRREGLEYNRGMCSTRRGFGFDGFSPPDEDEYATRGWVDEGAREGKIIQQWNAERL